MKRLTSLFMILLLLFTPLVALATSDNVSENYYIVYDNENREIFARGSKVYVGDMYQSSEDFLYKIVRVDEAQMKAWAEFVSKVEFGDTTKNSSNDTVFSNNKDFTVGIYQTHTDESYIPGDGTESSKSKGGIVDVGKSLASELEKNGFKVIFSEDSHVPHDSGAYQRSRRTAMEMIKKGADVVVDVHRDAIPAKYYKANINGKEVSKVRFVVGRQNPNQQANKQFAQKLKQIADKKYPGLVKDIYFARGGYNQDLGPRVILVEIGSHKISKKDATEGASLFAGVLSDYLGGGNAVGNAGSTSSIMYLVIGAIVVFGIFLFINYGSWGSFKKNVIDETKKRYASALAKYRKKDK
ncbi:stage II sporulation protein P [Clostridium sp. 'deep sea']|uniref:stage II sporulation protein P n=1 Tax=Clostridium sp. 'deep sea' TaxID=2779445 RepID=UPI00189698BD|nr:stage II sporulation protein P [Clostridium sp. 'deep sea']QOR35807.1 stage II sporulation protein P [Clostridium sp. 'deep sea']